VAVGWNGRRSPEWVTAERRSLERSPAPADDDGMTISSEPSVEGGVTTFRDCSVYSAPLRHAAPGTRHAAPGTGRHRAVETGEIRIVAAADCARHGRHADLEAAGRPEADARQDPLAWLGFRFTAG
jgi:hypothetical protein